jgi:asparaginyl-tRNA synthetase
MTDTALRDSSSALEPTTFGSVPLSVPVTTALLQSLTGGLVQRGFSWGLPVILSPVTDPLWPDPGSSIESRLELELYDRRVRVTQSMIIHKLLLVSGALPRLFFLSPNVRVERRDRADTGRHLYEFTQLDFEVRGFTSLELRALFEGVLEEAMDHLRQTLPPEARSGLAHLPPPPYPVRERRDLVERYGADWEEALSRETPTPVWVTDLPREFYDYEDPSTHVWDNFDLYLPRLGEVLSGSRREWELARILQKMQRDGVSPEAFRPLLRRAEKGALLPSAGAGLGIERLVAWLVGASHVGEVQLFPRIPGTVPEL